MLYSIYISSIGKCALDANKQKDATNGKAATCGLSSFDARRYCLISTLQEMLMNTLPDYSRFHIHELKDRLKALDPQVDQEEIQEIHRWIEKGGYQFPSSNPTDAPQAGYSINRKAVRTKFHSPKFIMWLVVLLSLMLLWNLYALLYFRLTFALVSIAFDGAILYCLYRAHPTSKLLVKTWAGLMAVSGSFGLIASLLRGTLLSEHTWSNVFYVAIGIYVWKKSHQSMEVIYADTERTN